MRLNIISENDITHITIEDEICPYYSLEFIVENDQVLVKVNGKIINSVYTEDLDRLTISDFKFNKCVYELYKKFLHVLMSLIP